jgi:hypothetical protein
MRFGRIVRTRLLATPFVRGVLVAALLLAGVLATGTWTARPAAAADLDARVNGSGHCVDGVATRIRVVVRPKPSIDPSTVEVVGGPMQVTNVDGAPNAWVVHLKGPAVVPAHTVQVRAVVDGVPQEVPVAIPGVECAGQLPFSVDITAGPHCAGNGTANRTRLALRPKELIDPTSIGVTGGTVVLTNVSAAPNAWVAHLRDDGPLDAQTITVSAVVDGVPLTLDVDLPAFTCVR